MRGECDDHRVEVGKAESRQAKATLPARLATCAYPMILHLQFA